MISPNVIKNLAVTTAITTHGLNINAPNVIADQDVSIYIRNSCHKGMTVWYEWINNDTVQGLQTVEVPASEKKFIKTTPYRWFRAYARVWDGGYEWDGPGRAYTVDGRRVQIREYDLNGIDAGKKFTINFPCSNN